MKLWTALILMVLIVSSCATQKCCLKKFPVVADTVKVVHVRDSLVYRDTVIAVLIPGDTIIYTDSVLIPCPPPPPQFIPDTATVETSLAVAWAWWDHPFIRLKLVQRDTTVFIRLDSALREAYHWKELYQNVTTVVTDRKIPGIYKIALWAWIIFIALILFTFIRHLFK
jgi:hypothetical protein